VVGALALWREGDMIREEVGRARAMPKGQWTADPAREAALDAKRADLFQKLFGDVGNQSQKFLNQLADKVLTVDTTFTATLDKLIAHEYTKLANKTVEQGLAALKRYVKTPEGAKALDDVQLALRTAAQQRVGEYVREELDYRLEQLSGYLGWETLGKTLKAWVRGTPGSGPAAAREVSEALHWTHLIDKIVSGHLRIVPATRENLSLLRLAFLLAALLAVGFLALRDALGHDGSPGKRHAGLRVVDARTGEAASVAQRALRGIVLVVLLPIELVLALVDQRIGDRVAKTRVVREEPAS
jgi:hypothetical protein